jgi:hypothetical protein
MGNCFSWGGGGSSGMLFDDADGDEQDYQKRFLEDQILGEGTYGSVLLLCMYVYRMYRVVVVVRVCVWTGVEEELLGCSAPFVPPCFAAGTRAQQDEAGSFCALLLCDRR